MIYDMIFLYSSHSREISKITAAVHIRASMKININHKTKFFLNEVKGRDAVNMRIA